MLRASVITVCWNNASTIVDTLRSVSAQTHPAVEHIVVDGGSTDGTLDLVRRYGERVTHVVSERDDGIYHAMNKGLGLATGDIVGFLNSDDFYATPTAIETMAGTFADPTVDACFGDMYYVKQDDTTQIVRYWKSSAFRPGLFRNGWCPGHPTFFVRKSVYERLGYFDTSYRIASDVELMMRFLERHRIGATYIPQVLVKMRMGGTTNRSVRNVIRQNMEIWRALKTHGLRPSVVRFIGAKLVSRGGQFLRRPASS